MDLVGGAAILHGWMSSVIAITRKRDVLGLETERGLLPFLVRDVHIVSAEGTGCIGEVHVDSMQRGSIISITR